MQMEDVVGMPQHAIQEAFLNADKNQHVDMQLKERKQQQ